MQNNSDIKYAGFWVRMAAFIIDVLILSIPMKLLESVVGLNEWFTIIFSFTLLWFYYGYLVYRWRGTIGKKILGIEILNYDLTPISLNQASLRFLYSLLTYSIIFAPMSMLFMLAFIYTPLVYAVYVILLLPILMIFMTDKKQVLHDYLAKVVVVDIAFILKNKKTKNMTENHIEEQYDRLSIADVNDKKVLKEKKNVSGIKTIRTILIIIVIGFSAYSAYALYSITMTMSVFSSIAKHKSQKFHAALEKYQSIDDHNDSRIIFYVKELEKSGEEYLHATKVPKVFKARVKRKLALNCIGYFLQEHNDKTWLDQVQAVDRNQLNMYTENVTIYNKRKSDKNWDFYDHYYFNELYDAQEKIASSFDKEISQYSCDKLQTSEEMFDRFLLPYIDTKENTLDSSIIDEKKAPVFGTLNKKFYQKSIKDDKKLLKILYEGFPQIVHMKKKREVEKKALAIKVKKREAKKKEQKSKHYKIYEKDVQRGVPPLFAAIQNHLDKKLFEILDSGADIEMKNKFGTTPLSFAIYQHDDNLVKILLEYGANPNVTDGNGLYSLLSEVCVTNRVSTAKLLLQHGADVNYQYNKNETALTVAAKSCKNFEMVKLLLEYGANPMLEDRFNNNLFIGLKRYCRDNKQYQKMKRFIEKNRLL